MRHAYQVLRTDGTVARYVTFAGNRFQRITNMEGAVYAMDHWTPREGIAVEAGLRSDWDQVVRDVVWSPRLSVAWAPKSVRDTKLSAGFGIFHDALTLSTLARNQDQVSYSSFFYPNGLPRRAPVYLRRGTAHPG
jgi:outer membrane receptor for ferrienterochelin and colicin